MLKGPLLVSTSSVWLHGSKGTENLNDRRTFRSPDLGFEYSAPTADHTEEGNGLYSKENRNKANELVDPAVGLKLISFAPISLLNIIAEIPP